MTFYDFHIFLNIRSLKDEFDENSDLQDDEDFEIPEFRSDKNDGVLSHLLRNSEDIYSNRKGGKSRNL